MKYKKVEINVKYPNEIRKRKGWLFVYKGARFVVGKLLEEGHMRKWNVSDFLCGLGCSKGLSSSTREEAVRAFTDRFAHLSDAEFKELYEKRLQLYSIINKEEA